MNHGGEAASLMSVALSVSGGLAWQLWFSCWPRRIESSRHAFIAAYAHSTRLPDSALQVTWRKFLQHRKRQAGPITGTPRVFLQVFFRVEKQASCLAVSR